MSSIVPGSHCAFPAKAYSQGNGDRTRQARQERPTVTYISGCTVKRTNILPKWVASCRVRPAPFHANGRTRQARQVRPTVTYISGCTVKRTNILPKWVASCRVRPDFSQCMVAFGKLGESDPPQERRTGKTPQLVTTTSPKLICAAAGMGSKPIARHSERS